MAAYRDSAEGRNAIIKENPKFNLLRPSVKEQEKFERSRAEESKKDLVHRLVQFNPLYSVVAAAKVLFISPNKMREIIKSNEIGHIARQRKPRKNRFGIETCYPEYLITGWQLIEYIEHLSSRKEVL